ncbi:MAG: pyruvate dehydrogenase complex dihydrolipoamide acetyltransferase [candidate division NC10 bacterium]|jgi:pyruvate dehydrogenase E2 component (dihydrolipoamide acetyltransferase)|nr:pyruvate dehydrogenase complex dihydrolipoamide acetyltransferase [candidate division NC10 bacterium]
MPSQVIMPKLSDAMTEGRLLQWLKKEGDRVQGGDVLASIETDKAEIELESFAAGILRKILVAEGDMVPVGKLIAIVAEPDEDISALLAGASAAATPPAKAESKAPAAAAQAPAPPAPPAKAAVPAAPPKGEIKAPASAPQAPAESGWIPASPIARRMARDAGIDLSKVSGSGPGGRILERDVEAHVAAQAQRLGGADVPTGAREFEDKDLSTIRKTIASRMVQSKAPIPHFTVTVEADMGAAQDLRTSLNAIDPNAEKLSVNHILIKAVALALKRNPAINAAYHDGQVRLFKRVHIGVAVALEDGLIVPVIRECDRKSLGEIAHEAKGLIERARNKKLRPDEYSGGTFAISNLGMYDVVEFTAVIDPAHGAILAVGAIEEKPVVMNGQIVVRHRMRLTGSFDHRIIDGAMGAKFLQEVKKILENPVQLLL